MNEPGQNTVLHAPATDTSAALQSAPQGASSAGGILREGRQAAGMSLEQLSARVKVSVPRLLALEEGRLQEWPDANMARAVAASVCRHLRLDPMTVLALMPKPQQSALSLTTTHTVAGLRDGSGFKLRGGSGARPLPRGVITVALGLAALGLLVALVGPNLPFDLDRFSGNSEAAGSAPAAVEFPEPVLPPGVGPTDTRVLAAAGAASEPASTAAIDSQRSASAPVPAPILEPRAIEKRIPDPAATLEAGAPAARALVSFTARGTTWIEVIDAKNTLLLRRTMVAGDTAAASGALPLSVVVGRADLTEVAVRGRAFALEPSPDNVARFKVQ